MKAQAGLLQQCVSFCYYSCYSLLELLPKAKLVASNLRTLRSKQCPPWLAEACPQMCVLLDAVLNRAWRQDVM